MRFSGSNVGFIWLQHGVRFTVWTLLSIGLLASCASPAAQENTTVIATEPAIAALQSTATPEVLVVTPTAAAAAETGPLGVVVWWPEALAPLDNETAAEVLSVQLSAFQSENSDIFVEFRLKKIDDVGGILSTLRTASAVAPGALPDLTLIRRADLLIAAQAGLIQPLGDRLSPAALEDVQEVGLELGRIGDDLYGMPYTLEVQHSAYNAEVMPEMTNWRFNTVLNEQLPFAFPAGRASGVNNVLLMQYLASGGQLSDTGGVIVDADALETTLAFYEQAVADNLVAPAVLEYIVPDDYEDLLIEGQGGLAVINSTLYLELTASGVDLGVGPIPTLNGEPVTVVDGWMWVLTTSDVDRQARAMRFLNWMLDAERQAAYTDVIHMLPSQRSALRQIDDSDYAEFVAQLLANAYLPLTESESGTAARAMQNALVGVLTGQQTAAQATRDVVDQVNG